MSAFRKLVPVLFVAWFTASSARAQCEVQTQEFAPPDVQSGDAFGYRIVREGALAVMAAPFDDDRGVDAGAAYVYERDATGWKLAAKLHASNAAAGAVFGYSVAITGSTVFVGAPRHDAPSTPLRGMVYAFERDRNGIWREVSRLAPPSAVAGAQYGWSLAAEGDHLLVGMPFPGGVPVLGHALLYVRDSSRLRGWTLEHDLVAADPATGFDFGHAVAMAGDVIAVAGATESVVPYADSYVVHVFERGSLGDWSEVRSLASPTGTRDLFAYKIALTEDTLVAVAPAELPPTFVYGAVYLYARGPGGSDGWGLARRLYSPNATSGQFTAELCVLSRDWLVAGVPGGGPEGSVYLFGRNVGGPDTWGEVATLRGEQVEEYSGYGQGLALEGDELLVGQSGYSFTDTGGEAYAYDLSRLALSTWRGDSLGMNYDSYEAGRAILGDDFSATVDLGITGHPLAVLSWFEHAAEVPLPGGQVLLGANRLGQMTAAGPVARFELRIPNVAALCGRTFATQAAHIGGGLPFVLSNAQDVRIGVR